MQGLTIRVAKAINRGERSGKVFRDRYHSRELETPRQVRNAIAYVVLNARRHTERHVRRSERPRPARWIDPCSSGYWFDGWRGDVDGLRRIAARHLDFPAEPPIAAARTWLLGVGWRRWRLIDPSEVPGR
jgi:hypothetical protein